MKRTAPIIKKLSLLVLLSLMSCSSDRDESPQNNDNKIYSYQLKYMDTPYFTHDLVLIDYIENKPTKRTSDFTIWSTTSPTSITSQYEEVTYNENVINIITKSLLDHSEIRGTKEKIVLNNKGDIQQKIYYKDDYTRTSDYQYSQNKLIKIVSTQEGYYPNSLHYQKDFYYNAKNNLDSIVTKHSQYNEFTQQYELNLNSKKREVERFYEYDNSINTTKSLKIFDDVFNRTLSNNCFKKYVKNFYDENGKPAGYHIKNWNYVYTNGLIDYSK